MATFFVAATRDRATVAVRCRGTDDVPSSMNSRDVAKGSFCLFVSMSKPAAYVFGASAKDRNTQPSSKESTAVPVAMKPTTAAIAATATATATSTATTTFASATLPRLARHLPDPDVVAALRKQLQVLTTQQGELSRQLYHYKVQCNTDEQTIVDRVVGGDYPAMFVCRTLESKRELLRMATLTSDPDVTIAVVLFLKVCCVSMHALVCDYL